MSVGVDIGTATITLAEVKSSKGQPVITEFSGAALPAGSVSAGEILDPDAVGATLRELVSAAGIKDKKVHVGVSNQQVAVRMVNIPKVEDSEINAAVRLQAGKSFPFEMHEAELDYHVLGESASNDGEATTLHLLVAAGRIEMLNIVVEAIKAAKLTPVSIDLAPFALLRTLGGHEGGAGTANKGPHAIIDVGAGVTDLIIYEDGQPRFVRMVQAGLGTAEKPDAQTMNGILDELYKSLNYFVTSSQQTPAGALLTGGAALVPGFVEKLTTQLGMPVEVGDTFKHWPTKTEVPDELKKLGPLFAHATGLALGGLD